MVKWEIHWLRVLRASSARQARCQNTKTRKQNIHFESTYWWKWYQVPDANSVFYPNSTQFNFLRKMTFLIWLYIVIPYHPGFHNLKIFQNERLDLEKVMSRCFWYASIHTHTKLFVGKREKQEKGKKYIPIQSK